MSFVWVPVLAAFSCIYLGMLALNLAMDRNAKLVFQQSFSSQKNLILRCLGYIGLVFGLGLCLYVWGAAIGFAAWCGILTFAVGLLIFVQSYYPRYSLHLASVWSVCTVLVCAVDLMGWV
ncbi:DUF3325 domain-containing protein [Acinetobacter rudis]|uniref:DUF3325 domain-containing protein n=1 Tax=Acinetobacter rudis TaxID=632955 RepID=UPI0033403DA7